MPFNFLPGTQVQIVDGGLAARQIPVTKSLIILGTSGTGPADTAYQVADRAIAAQLFGFDGTIIQGLEEVGAVADNVFLYRMGTSPLILHGVGLDTVALTDGFDITFGTRDATSATDYKIWYKDGDLAVWLNGSLVYTNDTGIGAVDTGDISFSVPASQIASQMGLQLGSSTSPTLANAVTITAAVATVGTLAHPAPTVTAVVTGLGLTGRQTYVAMAKALELLSIFPVEEIYCPNVVADERNVAYYVSSDVTTALHNPATNPDALDWLKTISDSFGNKTYQWAADSVDDQGGVTVPMSAVTSSARIAAGFHEVHPVYALAQFCEAQLETVGSCQAFIGTSGPKSFTLGDTRRWIGFLPTYDPVLTTKPVTAGSGLLGIPVVVGTTSAMLNSLTKDHATFRAGGMAKTAEGQYDGSALTDRNGNPIDLGQFVCIQADIGIISNGFATNYAANMAGVEAGYKTALDEKSNLTNKPVNAAQLWKASQGQLDALFQAGVNVLRFKGDGQLPVWLHGETIAEASSDYQNLLRVAIRGLVVDTVRSTADPFIGQGSTDGLTLQALQTALDQKMLTLQKRGYISRYSFKVYTSQAQERIGHANIDVNFMPASELIQLNATIGISRM